MLYQDVGDDVEYGPCDGNPLPLSSGQSLAAAADNSVQGQHGSERGDALVDGVVRKSMNPAKVLKHLARGEPAEQPRAATQVTKMPLG